MIDEYTCRLCYEHCIISSINVTPEERQLAKACFSRLEARRRKALNVQSRLRAKRSERRGEI